MYVLLTGERRNAGDFLIAASARKLIERFSPVAENISVPSWLPLQIDLETVNSSKALILCGGPALQRELGRGIYPITDLVPSIKVPIIAFGLGWKSHYGDRFDQERFRFEDWSKPLLERIVSDFPIASCRDHMTCRVMRKNGLDNVLMTGCPAWYDPDYLDQPLRVPHKGDLSVIYTPARNPLYRTQSINLMASLAKFFGSERMVCSFHEGWTADDLTPVDQAENSQAIKHEAERLGLECINVAGSAANLERYEQADLHVGYRVHAHFKFLAVRRPSFLIPEDSRGVAVMESMGMPPIENTRTTAGYAIASSTIKNPRVLGKVRRRVAPFTPIPDIGDQVTALLEEEMDNEFARIQGVIATIRATWPQMHKMLEYLPA